MAPPLPRTVVFGPPHTGKTALHAALSAEPAACEFLDSDGQLAGAVIASPDRLQELNAEIAATDAVILLLDIAAGDREIDEQFRAFARLLARFEDTRTRDREVGGMPVFLTLTKCDAAAKPGDEPAEWQARIARTMAAVRTRFEAFLAGDSHDASNPLPFGSIDLHVAATAIRFPKTSAFVGFGEDAFGIEDLRDDSAAAAVAFAQRRQGSQTRLRWTVRGTGVLVGVMAATLGLLVATAPSPSEQLRLRVQAYKDHEGTAAVRLTDRAMPANRNELEAIQADALFAKLPDEARQFVTGRLAESAEYAKYRDRFLPPQLGPADVRTVTELAALDAALAGPLAPPAAYAAEWADANAVRLWAKWRTDAGLWRAAQNEIIEWYRGRIRRGTELTLNLPLDARWRQDATAVLTSLLPFPADAVVPGSARLPIRRGAALTYAPLFDSDRVEAARGDWEMTRRKLANIAGLADALGMTGTTTAPLDLPEPTGEPLTSLPLARERLKSLPTPDDWKIDHVPEPVRSELRNRLQRSYDIGVRHVQRLILHRLGRINPGFGETAALWPPVRAWLGSDADVQAWGRLLHLIARLGNLAPATDPVADLVLFLARDRFDLVLKEFTLRIPDDLRDRRVVPDGVLVIAMPTRKWSYRPVGVPTREGSATFWRFIADGHDGTVTLRPGEELSATLPLRTGEKPLRLDWRASRTQTYIWERLLREPQFAPNEPATGVRLTASPELPAWPVLMPDVGSGR